MSQLEELKVEFKEWLDNGENHALKDMLSFRISMAQIELLEKIHNKLDKLNSSIEEVNCSVTCIPTCDHGDISSKLDF